MPDPTPPHLDEFGALRALGNAVVNRIVSGLLLALPIAVTLSIIYYLYATLQGIILNPLALLVNRLTFGRNAGDLPLWWDRIVAPLIAIAAVVLLLYILGHFVRTRVGWLIDWVMTRLPGVTLIYTAVRNVLLSLDSQRKERKPQRMVLVAFPHPGMRALAMVTRTLRDAGSGKTILCVYVMTAVVPPAGFTLFVPEDDVIDVDWTVTETFQAILSGGMTAPGVIHYHTSGPTKLIVPGRPVGEPTDATPSS